MRSLCRFWVGAGVVGFLVAGAAGQDAKTDEAVKEELKKLEGKWRVVAAEQGGKKVEPGGGVVIFSGDKCTIVTGDGKIKLENTITLDPSKEPKRMDVTRTADKLSWPGIYEVKGDTMKAVFQGEKGGKRPTEFKTKKGTQEVMYTYERVKP